MTVEREGRRRAVGAPALSVRRPWTGAGSRRGRRLAPIALRWGSIGVVLAGWQLALRGGEHSYLAPPTQILAEGVPYVLQGEGRQGLLFTAQEFLVAFAIAAVAGVVLGAGLGLLGRLAPPLGDAVYLLYTLPQVPFYPLFILVFGVGPGSEIAFGVSHGVLPVLLGVMAATTRADPTLLTAVRSMGAGHWASIRYVVGPASVPEVVTALRVGAGLTLIGVTVGQVLVSVDGVGGLIGQLTGSLRPAPLDAVILVIAVAAMAVNVVLHAGERRLSRWRVQSG